MKERENFGSRIGFLLVSAGCAVGLGNVWKFPYICGENGGAIFIIVYLLFLLGLGLPILICEFSVGRGSRKGIALAYDSLEPEHTHWHKFKWMGIIGNYLLMMFYTMVGGWMLYYAYRIASGKLKGLEREGISVAFQDMLQSPGTMSLWMLIAILLSFGVCALGLNNGIEKITKFMMSALMLLMVVLAIRSVTLPNASAGVRFYLFPDFSKLTSHGISEIIFAAMTHAFFTLSVGMGSMEIFGSYLKKDRTLAGEALNVLFLDTFVALTAGLIIIPACFAYGIQPDAGPSLLFITLPTVFNDMGAAGRIWGTLFFIFMSFAALSTMIAVFENIISFYIDLKGWTRKKAVIMNLLLITGLSIPAVLGYNVLSGFEPLGAGSTIMDLEDFLVSYNVLPLGSMVFVLFCVRKNGWGWTNFLKEVNEGTGFHLKHNDILKFYMSHILPLIIVFVYLKGYYDYFSPMGLKKLIFWMCFAFALLGIIFAIVHQSTKKYSSES